LAHFSHETSVSGTVTPIPAFAKKGIRRGSIGFFLAITFVAIFGIPLYVFHFGLRLGDLILFFFYSFFTILAITAGYHRYYSHRSFKAHPVIEFFLLFFGAAAVQQSALKWSALHRQHHRYTDTERDPYNIKQGFFHAHIGWLLFWKYRADYDCVKDLNKSFLVRHQHEHFQSWVVTAGILTPVLIGGLYGSWLGGLLFGVAGRLFWVYHSTFFINSIAHTFGKKPYISDISAKDNWFAALLTNGEGYHNFHHRFPLDYRNGYRWYQLDPTKWFIRFLAYFGLTWDLKATPDSVIQNARKNRGYAGREF